MSDELTKSLAERVTPGPYLRQRYTGIADSHRICTPLHTICGRSNKLCGSDAELILEAFNVTHETGRTPRQLADAVKKIHDIIFGPPGAPVGSNNYFEIRKICTDIIYNKPQ